MSDSVRVMVERPKKKRAVASALDWPGWGRSAKIEDQAIEVLELYRPRYALVAERAGLGHEFARAGALDVVATFDGNGMSDYYGVSGQEWPEDEMPMSAAECERRIAILEACWAYFDDVASRVSAELREGPRGGGRDRDRIVRHVNAAEIDEHAKKVGVYTPDEVWQDVPGHRAELQAHREAIVAGIRDYNARGVKGRTWTLPFLIRRISWHFLDHAWEMEDRDLTGQT
jgi:hypothetical protein